MCFQISLTNAGVKGTGRSKSLSATVISLVMNSPNGGRIQRHDVGIRLEESGWNVAWEAPLLVGPQCPLI